MLDNNKDLLIVTKAGNVLLGPNQTVRANTTGFVIFGGENGVVLSSSKKAYLGGSHRGRVTIKVPILSRFWKGVLHGALMGATSVALLLAFDARRLLPRKGMRAN